MRVLFGAVDGMSNALSYHRERHTVLAGNVANLDTPGYAPADLIRTGAGSEAQAGTLQVTHAGHIAATDETATPAGTEVVHDELPQRADGNNVSLERELAKVEANRLRYQATSELVSKKLALLRYAAGDGV